MINYLLGLLLHKPVQASTIVQINCNDYEMEEVFTKNTKTYVFSLCLLPEESNHAYYYLGGTRKNNEDLFTLLPASNWGLDYFVVEDNGFFYKLIPGCGPNEIEIFKCSNKTPAIFSIYKGKKLLDSEEVIN